MKQKRLLIVDDSDDARKGLVLFLSAEGYGIDEASSGEEAIEYLKGLKYDLVLTDLKMQKIDGIGVLTEAKKLQPETEVIIMTAYATVESAVDAMKRGAYHYIAKPINVDEMNLLVKRCLRKQELAEEVAGLKEVINLYEVSKGLNSLMNLDQLLSLIIKLAADTLDAEGGSIMLMDDKTEELIAKATTGPREEVVLGKRLKLGERIAGYAAKEKNPVRIDGSIKEDPRFSHLEKFDGINSSLSIPLMRKSKLLGVINLNRSSGKKGFTEHDSRLLAIFAAQAAIAIENSYLFNNLIHEKEILDTVFSKMGDGALLLDGDLNVVIINSTAEKIFDIKGKDYIKRNINDCIVGFTPSISWEALKKSEKKIIDFDLVKSEGSRTYLSVYASKIAGENEDIHNYIMVFRDVTEEKNEELIKKNFVRLMSHKLRTPLTSILGFTSLLNKKSIQAKLNEAEQGYFKIIDKESQKLASLVDKLLRFTLLESESLNLKKTRQGLLGIIKSSLFTFDNLIKENGVKVIVSENIGSLPPVNIDKEKIQEVFENLIENAIKFNDKPSKMINIRGIKISDDLVQVEVVDNGPGIPFEEADTIFQKYYQLEKYFTGQVEGSGLGLSLVKRIIEAHKGEIWVESNIDKESRFIFTLPVN